MGVLDLPWFVNSSHCFSYLWFFMEPILAKADNYSFLKKLVENVKETRDAQAPDDEEVNKVNTTLYFYLANV